jgi:hypothetical protein
MNTRNGSFLFMNTQNSDCDFANLTCIVQDELTIGHVEQDEAEKHEK